MGQFQPYVFVSCVYILAAWITRALFQGDTNDYVISIVAHANGRYIKFWEFGHLLWRPLGWFVFRLLSIFNVTFAGTDQRIQVTLIVIVLSWVAGLVSALLLLALLRLYCPHGWVPQLVAASFVFSTAVLNYSRTGSSYVPGLSLLILGMYLIVREEMNPSKHVGIQICAALALAGSVSLWFLYALSVPAAILLPFASGGADTRRFRLSIGTLLFFCLIIASAYIGVLVHLRLFSAASVLAWIVASSHGIAIHGVSRAIFGWPRSFIYMGDAGRIIKRYLVHDPFNPISARDLFRLWPELLKIALFYMALFSIIVNLGRIAYGRRALVIAAAAALPVCGFAIHWSGGDLERYLPLYPALFIVLTLSLAEKAAPNWTKVSGWLFVLCVVLTNAVTLRSAAVRDFQTRAESRVIGLMPRLKQGSVVIVSHNLDDLVEFNSNFPFSPINLTNELHVYPLLTPGSSDIARWRENFASQASSVWRAGGDIWISNRVLHPRPQADWNWVEGDDKRVSWADMRPFFSQLQYGESIGGDDGFLLLLPSNENQTLLDAVGSKVHAMRLPSA